MISPQAAHWIGQILIYLLLGGFVFYILHQVRKPTRWVGRFFLWIMNMSHSSLTDWGLGHVQIEKDFAILDVGCGGGRTIEKLAALASDGKVCGVDYSEGSVAASRARNAKLIQAGRAEIEQGSVSRLPFPDGSFDLVTAVETQYYWPDLVNDMKEIRRVLKSGGRLLVMAESYKTSGAKSALERSVMALLRSSNLDVDAHRQLFSDAGYTDIEIFEQKGKGWLCGIGLNPRT